MIIFLERLQSGKGYFVSALFMVLLQTIIIFSFVESRADISQKGQDILLRVQAIDPRDLIKGEYVRLNYPNISAVSQSLFVEDIRGKNRYHESIVWVRLKKGNAGFWIPSQASFRRLEPRPDTILLKGKNASVYSDHLVYVDYGIERYFVPEGKGSAIENASMNGKLSVSVKVSNKGVAQINQLFVDGKAFDTESVY